MIRQKYLFRIIMPIFLLFSRIVSSPQPNSNDQQYIGYLILLFDGDACHCVQERNQEIQKTIINLISASVIDTSIILYRHYDYATQPELVNSILKLSNERFLPVLILKSQDNFLFYECSFEMDSAKFVEGLTELTNMYKSKVEK